MTKFVLVSAILGVFVAANAQPNVSAKPSNENADSTTVTTAPMTTPEPEFAGQVALLANGTLAPLEAQRPHPVVGAKFLRGASVAYAFAGLSSNAKAGMQPEFVAKLAVAGDPALMIELHGLEVDQKAGVRKVTTVTRKGLLGGKNTNLGDGALELVFSPYGASSLKFSPATALSPGEYVVAVRGGGAFTFRVE